jgi:AraC family transcriptional regulator, transcriptional activator of pobA
MKKESAKPVIDKVIYNFKGNMATQQIDVVPIAKRLLTAVNKTRTTAPHRTSFYRIIWFQEGNPVHTVDFKKIKITSPSLLFIQKDKIHKFDKNKMHDGKVLIFTDDFLFRTETNRNFLQNAQIFNTAEPVLLKHVDDNLKYLFNTIEDEILDAKQHFKSDVLYHLLNTFLYTAERLTSIEYPNLFTKSANISLVNSFLELMENNYKKRLSIEKYATLLHVTVTKLNQALHDVKGRTGKEIVTERLLLEAKRLLAYSDLNIKETAFELGFKEPTNFVKFFQGNAKQTPVQFQKTNA